MQAFVNESLSNIHKFSFTFIHAMKNGWRLGKFHPILESKFTAIC